MGKEEKWSTVCDAPKAKMRTGDSQLNMWMSIGEWQEGERMREGGARKRVCPEPVHLQNTTKLEYQKQ